MFSNIFKRKTSISSTNPNSSGLKLQKHPEQPQNEDKVANSEKLVDLVFVVDNTGSMSSEIQVAKQTVQNIITEISNHFEGDTRFATISYRDHSDDVTLVEGPFTNDIEKAREYVNEMNATGGGDYPEALATALYQLSKFKFNKKGRKIVVWIADAPPHGMGASGDNYPKGCADPDHPGEYLDWIKLASAVQEQGVVFYTIICERAANDTALSLFMDYLARKTNGMCLLLTNASKIPNLIIHGAVEDLEMDKLVQEKVQQLGENAKKMSDEQLLKEIEKEVQEKQIKVKQVHSIEVNHTNTADLLNATSANAFSASWYQSGAAQQQRSITNEEQHFEYATTSAELPTAFKLKKAVNRSAMRK